SSISSRFERLEASNWSVAIKPRHSGGDRTRRSEHPEPAQDVPRSSILVMNHTCWRGHVTFVTIALPIDRGLSCLGPGKAGDMERGRLTLRSPLVMCYDLGCILCACCRHVVMSSCPLT